MSTIPSGEEAFEQLRPINELLYESYESVILNTSKHFKESGHPYDPHFFAHHIHVQLREVLEREAERYGFTIRTIKPNSYCLVYESYVYRLYKAYENSSLPLPNVTKACLEYYNSNNRSQPGQQALPGMEGPESVPPDAIKLIGYYGLTDESMLAWLRIACPQSATFSHVSCFWDNIVENPLNNIGSLKQSTAEREDLTYTLLEEDLEEDNAQEHASVTEREDLTYTLKNEPLEDQDQNGEESSEADNDDTSTGQTT